MCVVAQFDIKVCGSVSRFQDAHVRNSFPDMGAKCALIGNQPDVDQYEQAND